MDFPSSVTTTISTAKEDWTMYRKQRKAWRIQRELRQNRRARKRTAETAGLTLAQLYKREEYFFSPPPLDKIKVYTELTTTYSNATINNIEDSILDSVILETDEEDIKETADMSDENEKIREIENFFAALEARQARAARVNTVTPIEDGTNGWERMSGERPNPPGAELVHQYSGRSRTVKDQSSQTSYDAFNRHPDRLIPRRPAPPKPTRRAAKEASRLSQPQETQPAIPLEIITPVHRAANENDRGSIRTQVLRGTDHLTGLARHEFKRDGQFGAPPPNPIGMSATPLATMDANIRTVELDTNVCKAEWAKSTVDWPLPHLFEKFRQGFDDVKYAKPDEAVLAKAKGVKHAEVVLTNKQWEDRAYAYGVQLGNTYMSNRPPPKSTIISDDFDYDRYSRGPQMDNAMGNLEAFFQRIELQEQSRRREERKEKWEKVGSCQCCNIL